MLQEYDVDVVAKGSFTVYARSLEEAQQQIEDMDPEELKERVLQWISCEAEVS
jgi:hypothetical protein